MLEPTILRVFFSDPSERSLDLIGVKKIDMAYKDFHPDHGDPDEQGDALTSKICAWMGEAAYTPRETQVPWHLISLVVAMDDGEQFWIITDCPAYLMDHTGQTILAYRPHPYGP